MKIKNIICVMLVIFTIFMLSSCGYDPDKNDLSPYIELCDYSNLTYEEFVTEYEKYKESNSYTHGAFRLYNSDTINMYVSAEEIVENGDDVKYVAYNWDKFENNVEIKDYIIGKNDDMREFDKCLRYNVKKSSEISNAYRSASLGKVFSFEYKNIDGKNLRISVILTKYKPTGRYYNQYEAADYSDETMNNYVAKFYQNYDSNKIVCEDGDWAVISYKGILAGTNKEFEGNSGNDHGIRVGDGLLFPTFENELVGHKLGEEFKISMTIPSTYSDSTIAGKDVEYTVKINKLYDSDKVIQDNTKFNSFYELNYAIKVNMYIQYNLINYLLNHSVIKSYPQQMLNQYEKLSRNYVYLTVDEFIDYSKKELQTTYTREEAFKYLYSRDDMEEYITSNAKYEVGTMLVAYQIKKELNLNYTDEKYKEDLTDQTIAESLKDGVNYTEKEIETKYTKDRLKGYFIQNLCANELLKKIKNLPAVVQYEI